MPSQTLLSIVLLAKQSVLRHEICAIFIALVKALGTNAEVGVCFVSGHGQR